ncbi:hypothetical protein Dimus_032833 [Dionaea muscipula]
MALVRRKRQCSLVASSTARRPRGPDARMGSVGRDEWLRRPPLARWCATAHREAAAHEVAVARQRCRCSPRKLPMVVEEGGRTGWSCCSSRRSTAVDPPFVGLTARMGELPACLCSLATAPSLLGRLALLA